MREAYTPDAADFYSGQSQTDLVDLRAHILRRAFGRAELHDLFDMPSREPDEGA